LVKNPSPFGAIRRVSGCSRGDVEVGWFWEGSTMRNSKIAMLAYGLAVGFVLLVALHSPAKVLIASDAPASSTTVNPK
jgi:hypothetical protein